jgi:hypothetical protein
VLNDFDEVFPRAISVTLVLLFISVVFGYDEIDVTQYEVTLKKLPPELDGFKISLVRYGVARAHSVVPFSST